MPRARTTFNSAIDDATALLQQFDAVHKDHPNTGEVLSAQAWSWHLRFVRSTSRTAHRSRHDAPEGGLRQPARQVRERQAREELRRFHNPTAEKTRKLFLDDLEIDVNTGWKWQNHGPASARRMPDDSIGKRGDAVHRARPVTAGAPGPASPETR